MLFKGEHLSVSFKTEEVGDRSLRRKAFHWALAANEVGVKCSPGRFIRSRFVPALGAFERGLDHKGY